MTDTVLLAIDGPRATITLNDPAKHNRLDPAGLGLLRQAIEKADANPDVRVTVITGAGEKTFCSGYDLGSIPARQGGPAGRRREQLREGHGSPRGDAHADPVRAERRRLWRRHRHGAGLRLPPRRQGHALLHAGGALRPALLSERPAPLHPEGQPELRQARLPVVGGFHRRGPAARRLSRLAGRSPASSRPRSTRRRPSSPASRRCRCRT